MQGAGLVLKAIIEEGEGDIPTRMQQLALTEGALPSHLYTALYTRLTADGRLLGQRQLSRHLVGLWTTDNEPAMELLSRVLPRGLLSALDSKVSFPWIEGLTVRYFTFNKSMDTIDQYKVSLVELLFIVI